MLSKCIGVLCLYTTLLYPASIFAIGEQCYSVPQNLKLDNIYNDGHLTSDNKYIKTCPAVHYYLELIDISI